MRHGATDLVLDLLILALGPFRRFVLWVAQELQNLTFERELRSLYLHQLHMAGMSSPLTQSRGQAELLRQPADDGYDLAADAANVSEEVMNWSSATKEAVRTYG